MKGDVTTIRKDIKLEITQEKTKENENRNEEEKKTSNQY